MKISLNNLENRLTDFFEKILPFSKQEDVFTHLIKSLIEKIEHGVRITDQKRISPNILSIDIAIEHKPNFEMIPNWENEIKNLVLQIIKENELITQGPVTILHQWKDDLQNPFEITVNHSQLISGNTIQVNTNKQIKPNPSTAFAALLFTDGEIFSLERINSTIGRAEDNDLVIDNLLLSRYHAKIILEDKKATIYDLDSLKGTFVNGNKIEKQVLTSGDVIRLGDISMIYAVENDAMDNFSTGTKKLETE